MTRQTMTTVNDLKNWVHNVTANWDGRPDAMVDGIAEAIRAGDHPAWGTDWSEFLSDLPDLLTLLPGFDAFVGRTGAHADLANELEAAGFVVQIDSEDNERSVVIHDGTVVGEIRGDAEAELVGAE